MADKVSEPADSRELAAEVARLRMMVQALEERVRQLDALAHNDPLVPLSNRRGFVRQLERLIARLERYDEPSAMLYIDVDGLKRVNDTNGHGAGDAALVHVAQLLVDGTRTTDCVARLGGDEFGVLLTMVTETAAHETAMRLIQRVSEREFVYRGEPMPLSFAVGVTLLEQGDTPDAVIGRADKAMYAEKAAACSDAA